MSASGIRWQVWGIRRNLSGITRNLTRASGQVERDT